MALELNFSTCVKNACNNLVIKDTTGIFSGSTNPGGWNGDDNYSLIEGVQTATIQYLLPGETEYVIVDVADLLIQAGEEDSIAAGILLVDEDIDIMDGQIHIIYTVQTDATNGSPLETFTTESYIYSLCHVKCCVNKLWVKVAEGCGCCNDSLERAMEATALLEAIKNAACGSADLRDKLLAKLQRICKSQKCNCH